MKTVDRYMIILGIVVTLGFFSLLGVLSFIEIKVGNRDLLNIAIGILGTAFITIINYFFGSSQGSKTKTELLTKKEDGSSVG